MDSQSLLDPTAKVKVKIKKSEQRKNDKLDFIEIKIFSAPRTLYLFPLLLFRTYTLLDTGEGENI